MVEQTKIKTICVIKVKITMSAPASILCHSCEHMAKKKWNQTKIKAALSNYF